MEKRTGKRLNFAAKTQTDWDRDPPGLSNSILPFFNIKISFRTTHFSIPSVSVNGRVNWVGKASRKSSCIFFQLEIFSAHFILSAQFCDVIGSKPTFKNSSADSPTFLFLDRRLICTYHIWLKVTMCEEDV